MEFLVKIPQAALRIVSSLAMVAALGFAVTPATAQDEAPQNTTAQQAEDPSGQPVNEAAASEDNGLNAEEQQEQAVAASAAGKLEPGTPEYQEATIAKLNELYNLPAPHDTGIGAPHFWMPQGASANVAHHDFMWSFILWTTIIFSVIVIGLMGWFLIRYRARSEDEPDPTNVVTHSTTLEITWTVIPTCIVLVMFTLGFRGFLESTVAPPSAETVKVNGIMWSWSFTYPNGTVTPDLHLAKDRPVRFDLVSGDVLHSLYIPAFRLKKDVVPGRINSYWVEPTEEGVYELFCAEYCGQLHSQMGAKVFVYDESDYDDALSKFGDLYTDFVTGEPRPLEDAGKAIWAARGCQGCHSINGAAGTGPTWKGLWGAERQFTDGTSAVADENYVQESIYYPQRHIVQGYRNAMPSYAGQLTDKDVSAVIAFLKILADTGDGAGGENVAGEAQTAGDTEPSNAAPGVPNEASDE